MSIQIENLNYIYDQNTPFEKIALNNINLKIEKGQFVGLIGHTGSGKSTLIRHLNALLKPSSGTIKINGLDINENRKKLQEIRQKVGLVFQYPEHQLFEMTVYKDVAFGPENLGLSKDEIDLRVEDALKKVGLGKDVYDKSPFELSGGQKRRVAIAGILAMNPEILILDEPTAGLDPRGRDNILSQIKQMYDNTHNTVILVSHSMEDIAKLVERIIVMNNGRVELDGSPKYVFDHIKELEQIGLAVPQINYVMRELKEKGINVATDIYTVEAATDALTDYLKQVIK